MRPKVIILTDFLSKNDYALDELDFGQVNVERDRTIHVYLSNQTDVTAKWQLNYVKFPKKSTIGHNTTTPWELENMEKTDDPEVFEFSVTSGALKGKTLPLRKVPEGLLVPPVPKDEEIIRIGTESLRVAVTTPLSGPSMKSSWICRGDSLA